MGISVSNARISDLATDGAIQHAMSVLRAQGIDNESDFHDLRKQIDHQNKPQLPTRQGYYLGTGPTVFKLDVDDKWINLAFHTYVSAEDVANATPLTPLIPVGLGDLPLVCDVLLNCTYFSNEDDNERMADLAGRSFRP